MPAFTLATLPFWGRVIGAGAVAATGIYGAKKHSQATNRAADLQTQANTEAIAFEHEKEARRREEWDKVMAQEQVAWEAQQAQREPYVQASRAALGDLMRRAGLPFTEPLPSRPAPDFNRPMPKNWQPGDPTGTPTPTTTRDEPAPERSLLERPDLTSSRRYDGAAVAPPAGAPLPPRPIVARREDEISAAAYAPLAENRVPLSVLMRGRRRV